jgi:uncharacterized membrane protein
MRRWILQAFFSLLCSLFINAAWAHDDAKGSHPRHLVRVYKATLLWDTTNQIPFTGRALNNKGEVGGWVTTTGILNVGPYPHAALWKRGEVTRLAETDSTFASSVAAMNDRGVIVGRDEEWSVGWGASWSNGTLSMVGAMEDEFNFGPTAINNRGHVTVTEYLSRAFLLSDEAGYTDELLPLPGGHTAIPEDVNEVDHVAGWDNVGWSIFSTTATHRALLWRDGTVESLGTLPGMRDSQAMALNDFDRVVGVSADPDAGLERAFLWRHGQMRPLSLLRGAGGESNAALDINDWEQIVGKEITTGGGAHAVLWERGLAFDLNSLVRDADHLRPHVTLLSAFRINLWGQILATAQDDRIVDTELTYLLTPAFEWR